MCTIVRASDGGCLRTVNGGLAFENGWFASRKAGRLLHWEGETALWHLLLLETDHAVVRMASEAVGFEFPLGGRLRSYTADAEITDEHGRSTVVEVKRSERDLEDPDYRLTLAYVAEVCRRCGMGFRIVYREDLFDSIVHRRNVGLFASQGYAHVRGDHWRALAALRRRHGPTTTYGALAEALEPGHHSAGRAIVQALVVRRVLKMDLADWLDDESPVTIVWPARNLAAASHLGPAARINRIARRGRRNADVRPSRRT